MAKISLAKPYIPKSTIPELKKVLESGMLSEGVKTEEFERLVEDYTGAKHAIACTSCTTGLEMALRCAGVRRGEEVIVPDFTASCQKKRGLVGPGTVVRGLPAPGNSMDALPISSPY